MLINGGFFIKEIKVKMTVNNKNNTSNNNKTGLLPKHLSIIMDGNRRWAKKRNLPAFAGHRAGVKTIKMVIKESVKAGIAILTLYAFSTENWKRPQKEISSLMSLFREVIKKEKSDLIKNKIRVTFIGEKESLSDHLKEAMNELEEETRNNAQLLLNIAINYGSRSELCQAFNRIYNQLKDNSDSIVKINEDMIKKNLYTSNIPDPDLLIRTGGEKRISNFLLWQLAYTELWFTKVYWPDFSKNDLYEALKNYEKRVRKFGGEI